MNAHINLEDEPIKPHEIVEEGMWWSIIGNRWHKVNCCQVGNTAESMPEIKFKREKNPEAIDT